MAGDYGHSSLLNRDTTQKEFFSSYGWRKQLGETALTSLWRKFHSNFAPRFGLFGRKPRSPKRYPYLEIRIQRTPQ